MRITVILRNYMLASKYYRDLPILGVWEQKRKVGLTHRNGLTWRATDESRPPPFLRLRSRSFLLFLPPAILLYNYLNFYNIQSQLKVDRKLPSSKLSWSNLKFECQSWNFKYFQIRNNFQSKFGKIWQNVYIAAANQMHKKSK